MMQKSAKENAFYGTFYLEPVEGAEEEKTE